MKTRNKKNISLLQAVIKMLPKTYQAAPLLFILTSLISILHGVSFVSITVYTQRFLDEAILFVEKAMPYRFVIISLAMLSLTYLGNKILNSIFAYLYRVHGRKVQGKLNYDLNAKIGRLSAVHFEDTAFLDHVMKAQEGMIDSVWFSLTFFLTFTFYLPYFSFLAGYLYTKEPILVYSILFAFLPMLLTQYFRSKIFMNLTDEAAPIKRRMQYYLECMTGREYYKETRMLGAWQYFHQFYQETMRLFHRVRFKAYVKSNLFELAMKILTGISYCGILYLLFTYVLKGEISIGVFVAVFYSIERLYALMKELICDHVTYLIQDLGGITQYLCFMQLPERGGNHSASQNRDIIFNNVTFCYPHAKQAAVRKVSFHIKENETVAIVGENGSGKSTLIRLLTGLYQPSKGEVLLGGRNTKTESMDSLAYHVSAVFQKYHGYQMTLKDNIIISEPGIVDSELDITNSELGNAYDESCNKVSEPGDTMKDTAYTINVSVNSLKESRLREVLKKSGLSAENSTFNKGYDTVLSREFEGVEVSGGQWQRIAIARGYYRAHDRIVLDEPTAAIDPIEESRVYQQFAEICKDKTAIIVTHRLGSAKIADRILVMKQGALVEQGTHEELMKLEGEYTKLYQTQKQWY
jgi:ATP-binding cassette subfamily B protein